MRKLNFNLVLLSCFLIFGCNQTIKKESLDSKKEIVIYYNGCSDESEIISDLDYSIESNKAFLEKNQIKIQYDTIQNKCGYMLIWGTKDKESTSVMTDIELQKFVATFFEIK